MNNADVTVLYVIPRYEEMIDFFKTDSIRKSLFQEAAKITASAKGLASLLGTRVKTEIAEGPSAEEIIEATKSMDNGLIVMGSHGYRGVNKAIMGSTTERVILNAACPILVVR